MALPSAETEKTAGRAGCGGGRIRISVLDTLSLRCLLDI